LISACKLSDVLFKKEKVMKILFVDDHPDAKLLAIILGDKTGDEVIFADNGKSALEIFGEEGNIDVVITDGDMPLMNGAELAKEIHKINPSIRIALVSSSIEKYQPLVEGIADCFDKVKFPVDNPLQPFINWIKK